MKKSPKPETPESRNPAPASETPKSPSPHIVLPRQRAIKNICIQVEEQFSGRLNPEAFELRALLVFAFVLAVRSLDVLPAYVALLFQAAAAFYALTVLARRFRDLGMAGANLLQILIPLFVMVWIGNKLPSDSIRTKFEAVMWFWPAITLLRLFLQPSAPDPDNAP